MQLVAYGAEDLYLTGNPQITYFKLVYRRHTNFATEYIEQYFTTLPNFTTNQITFVRAKIDRNADLLYDTYLIYDLIRFIEINVDGQRLDIQYGQWLNIWSDLTVTESKRAAYDRLVGNIPKLRPGFGPFYPDKSPGVTIPRTRLYIPLEFWFCKNPGLAIPLIALQYTELFICVEFNPLNDLFTIGENNLSPSALFSICNGQDPLAVQLAGQGFDSSNVFWKFVSGDLNQNTFFLCNYIYLDTDERRKFAQSSHEYLIYQVQRRFFSGLVGGPNTVELDLFHPMKELIWVLQKDNVRIMNDWNNYTFLDLNMDYQSMKDEYSLKFDFLQHPDDINFVKSTEKFINAVELQPTRTSEPNFLGFNLSKTIAFNDFTNILLSATLLFNGQERFEERDHVFFNALQPYKYHTHSAKPGVNVYSFALFPEADQPSGTANFSRLNKVEMHLVLRRDIRCNTENDVLINIENIEPMCYNLFLYGVNYNVFRIMSGIGSLAFNI